MTIEGVRKVKADLIAKGIANESTV